MILLGCRDLIKGDETLKALALKTPGEGTSMALVHVDLEDHVSLKKAADEIKQRYGGLDLLINNAGFAYKNNSTTAFSKQADDTININYRGTRALCECLLKQSMVMTKNSRIVNVSSMAGKSKILRSESLRDQILSNTLTLKGMLYTLQYSPFDSDGFILYTS